MNERTSSRLSLRDGEVVDMRTVAHDDVERTVRGFRIVAYDIPQGCCGGYYPECNPLIPLWHHAERSKVPAAKSVPIRIERSAAAGA